MDAAAVLLDASTPPKKSSQKRDRRRKASTACSTCRRGRVRCQVSPGSVACSVCMRLRVECIVTRDDQRKIPISRAYVSSLSKQILVLQAMLKEGVSCTPSAALTSAPASVTGQELSDLDDFSPTDSPGHFSTTLASKALATDSQGLLKDGPGKQTWDRSPSVNSHALPGETGAARGLSSTAVVCPDHSPKYTHDHGYPSYSAIDYPIKRLRGSGQPVKDTFCLLSLEAQDYLLALFWDFYNSVIPLVHQRAFEEQRKQGLGRFYSTFLHICMLSIGYRYADKNRLDMQKIGQPTRENLLHKKAKAMLDFELEKPPTTPLIAALLLLGDLEWGVGRTKQAWLYGRMAARIALDAGLHLDENDPALPTLDDEIRKRTLSVCIICEQYWAAFLEPPRSSIGSQIDATSLKSLSGLCKASPILVSENVLNIRIYEAYRELVGLACEIPKSVCSGLGRRACHSSAAILSIAALDNKLQSWYDTLPESLRWTVENISQAPSSFFLLHQQYHAAVVSLHQWISILTELHLVKTAWHAARVAEIFGHHRQRHDIKKIFFTAVQHAQVAATALINALGSKQPADKWECNLQNLGSLFVAIRDMACTYRPAEDVAFHPQKLLAKIPGASSHHVATILAQDIATAPSAQKGSEDDAGSFQTVEMKTETVLAGFIVISDHNSSEERDYSSTCDMRKEKISEADHSQHRGSTAFVWDYGVQNLDSGRPKCGQVNTVGIDMGDTDIDGSRVARDDVKAQSILHLALLHEPQLLDFAFF